MYYLDANAFIYPALYKGPKASATTDLLKQIVSGDVGGATATLTIGEVVYIIGREEDRQTAIEQGRRILELPNLQILDVKGMDVLQALSAMETHTQLSPRDAIHYGTMRENGIHTIVSDDEDFDEVADVSRQPLESIPTGESST